MKARNVEDRMVKAIQAVIIFRESDIISLLRALLSRHRTVEPACNPRSDLRKKGWKETAEDESQGVEKGRRGKKGG